MKKVLLGLGKFVYFFTGFYVILTMNVHAYIDPSAVTYGIQAIAAVVVAIGALIAVFRHKIAAFFKRVRRKKRLKSTLQMMKKQLQKQKRKRTNKFLR